MSGKFNCKEMVILENIVDKNNECRSNNYNIEVFNIKPEMKKTGAFKYLVYIRNREDNFYLLQYMMVQSSQSVISYYGYDMDESLFDHDLFYMRKVDD